MSERLTGGPTRNGLAAVRVAIAIAERTLKALQADGKSIHEVPFEADWGDEARPQDDGKAPEEGRQI